MPLRLTSPLEAPADVVPHALAGRDCAGLHGTLGRAGQSSGELAAACEQTGACARPQGAPT